MKTSTKAHIAVLCTNLFFSANYSLLKTISPKFIGPLAVNLVRVGLSLLLFWGIWLFGKTSPDIRRRDIVRFIVCAITGVAINQTFFVAGLTMTSTIHASLLILISPIIITIFALWVLRERFTIFKGTGLCLGIGGAVYLVMQKESGPHAPNYLLGDLLILINAVSYAIYFILVKPLMETYSPLHVIRWVFTIGFLIIVPIGWHETSQVQWEIFEWQHVAILAEVSILGTFLAYYFNAYGIQNIGASTTGTYIYTQPVFAVLIAAFILGESFTIEKFIAAVFIFAGVFLVSYKNGNNEKRKS